MKFFLYTLLIAGLVLSIISCASNDDSTNTSGSTDTTTTNDTTTDSSESLSGSGVFIVAGLSGNILRSTDKGSSFDNTTSPTSNNLYGVGFGNNTFVGAGL